MTQSDFNVIVTEALDEQAWDWLGQRVNLRRLASDDPQFEDALATAAGLIVRTYTNVNAALLDKAPKLKVVARAGVGVDNIDVTECVGRGIVVVNAPDANTQAVVEYVFAMLLDRFRPRAPVSEALDQAAWQRLRDDQAAKVQLDELTLGILGLGRIGQRVAAVAKSLGMKCVYHDVIEIDQDQRFGAVPVGFDDLLKASDVLSIHVDGRAGNRGLIGAGALAKMKDDAVLVNTSRGFVVDTDALAGFLKSHPAAFAILDVHEPEPIVAGCPLLGLSNAVLTPHIAGRSETALKRMSDVVFDVWRVLNGEVAEHSVGE